MMLVQFNNPKWDW